MNPAPRKFPAPPTPPPPQPELRTKVQFGEIAKAVGHRIVLYGPGGVGKTTCASYAPAPVAFIDLDDSLPVLHGWLDSIGTAANILPVTGVVTWDDLRKTLQSDGWQSIKTVCIDTATKAEELAVAHTLANTLIDGKKATSIEGYGYGKGFGFVFDTFLPFLSDLDRLCRMGIHVILICHDCTNTVPNPAGEDYIKWEPRLQNPASGKASIRLRVKEWADHVLCLSYDVAVSKDGKGKGSGSKTVYVSDQPYCMAKSRTCQQPIPLVDPNDLWAQILK